MRPGRTRMTSLQRIALAALSVMCVAPVHAQDDAMTAIATPDQPTAIALHSGPVPTASQAEAWHRQYGSVFARNVSVARAAPSPVSGS